MPPDERRNAASGFDRDDRRPNPMAGDVVALRPVYRFKLRFENEPDAVIRVLKPFADLGHSPTSLLAMAGEDGDILAVAEFATLSRTHAAILTNTVRRLPGIQACEVVRLNGETFPSAG